MKNNQHKEKINEFKEKFEEKGYKCKKEFPIFFLDKFRKIDLACFKDGEKPLAMEMEKTLNAQVDINKQKLEKFRKQNNEAETCLYYLKGEGCVK